MPSRMPLLLLALGTACTPAAPSRAPAPAHASAPTLAPAHPSAPPPPATSPAPPPCDRPIAAIPYTFTRYGFRTPEPVIVRMDMSLGTDGSRALDDLLPVLDAHPDWRIALAVRTDGAT